MSWNFKKFSWKNKHKKIVFTYSPFHYLPFRILLPNLPFPFSPLYIHLPILLFPKFLSLSKNVLFIFPHSTNLTIPFQSFFFPFFLFCIFFLFPQFQLFSFFNFPFFTSFFSVPTLFFSFYAFSYSHFDKSSFMFSWLCKI